MRLAVPSILANITIPLVGLVDTAIVGHISNAAAIGGIAIGTMLFDLLYWNFGFLRVGTSGLTAQAYGKSQDSQPTNLVPEECERLLKQGLLIALVSGFVLWAIQWFFVTAVLWCVPCSAEVASVAREYFYIRIWAAPATLSLMTFKGWFIGMQDTRSPMAVDITVNVINMAASFLLAVNAGLGVAGVAWGTIIAQYSGLFLAGALVAIRYQVPAARLTNLKHGLRRYMRLNGNLFIRSLCFMVVYVGFTALASRYGDTELAVSSILMKLFMFFSYFIDGFAYAGEALVGKEWGKRLACADETEKETTHINETVRLLFYWSLGVGAVFMVIYALWGMPCLRLMTNDPAVLLAAKPYLGWLIAMPFVSTLAFMWDGVYTGAAAGLQIRNAMIYAALAFVASYLLCYHYVGVQALYIAYFAHLAARVIYLSVGWNKLNHKSEICNLETSV